MGHKRKQRESSPPATPTTDALEPGLYVVGTPIGHLDDLSFRAVETLTHCDLVLAEDTRRTLKLFQRYQLRKPLKSCHRFNEASRLDELESRIQSGAAIVLVSDSGMPVVSDPGHRLVEACRERGLPVTAVPGPSAVTTALALSGLDGARFYFGGFLPRKSGARRKALKQTATLDVPVIVYESPYRMVRLFGEILEVLGNRRVIVARELTKRHEEVTARRAEDWATEDPPRNWRGECCVVIAPEDAVSAEFIAQAIDSPSDE